MARASGSYLYRGRRSHRCVQMFVKCDAKGDSKKRPMGKGFYVANFC